MTRDARWSGAGASDAGFERALLDSARADECPADAPEAWSRFEARLAATALVPGALPPAGAAAVAPPATAARASWVHAVKWVVLGVVSGAVLTAGLLSGGHDPVATPARSSSPVRTDDETRPSPLRQDAQTNVTRAVVDGARAIPPRAVQSLAPRVSPSPSRRGRAALPPSTTPAASGDAASTLAAQVILVDGARAALAHGDPVGALRLVDRFHAELAGGALEPDAEVVAIEALAAQGRGADVAQRAARFLTRHPNDPHAPRVRALVEALGAPPSPAL